MGQSEAHWAISPPQFRDTCLRDSHWERLRPNLRDTFQCARCLENCAYFLCTHVLDALATPLKEAKSVLLCSTTLVMATASTAILQPRCPGESKKVKETWIFFHFLYSCLHNIHNKILAWDLLKTIMWSVGTFCLLFWWWFDNTEKFEISERSMSILLGFQLKVLISMTVSTKKYFSNIHSHGNKLQDIFMMIFRLYV